MNRLQRSVGVAIGAVASVGAVLMVWAGSGQASRYRLSPRRGVIFGAWHLLYDSAAPSVTTLTGAIGLALLLAAGIALVEHRVATRARRSLDRAHQPLAPRGIMTETRGVFAGPITVTVLIPAHNEAAGIGDTLESLNEQSRRPDRVIVVADNCTDNTVGIARAFGTDVFETVDNRHKKAGALNQVLAELLPRQGENDLVMVMDADTVLGEGFLASVVRRMTDDRGLMAVGALFAGDGGGGILGQFQRNEYTRYARDLHRRRGRVFVLTGTATVFRPRALRCVAAERGFSIPGVPGDVYDTVALTEDNEITLALKCLGALIISPADCRVVTEIMPTPKLLWAQRLRWQRGALENIGSYGFRGQTLRYWGQQLGIGYGVVALAAFSALMAITVLAVDSWVWFPFWVGIGLVFVAERVITVWRGGWGARLLAALLVPEMFYALFLDVVYLKGVADLSRGAKAEWSTSAAEGMAT